MSAGGGVVVAYLHPNTVSHSFSDSLMRLVAHDLTHEGHVVRTGGPVMFRCGPGGLVQARNDVVAHFLTTEHEWLWMVDSDMGFAPDTVDQLLAVADPDERPVIGALCFGMRETAPDGLQGWQTRAFPTLYDWVRKSDGEHGFHVRRDYPVGALVRVAGTGAACLLVHRKVFERIRDEHGPAWFERVRYSSGTPVSEDLSFCYRVAAAGMPIHVHTGVKTSHHKAVWLKEDDYWRSEQAPPATQETAVLVPVLGRPQNAEPFMRSLRASTGLATAYALVGGEDSDEATEASAAAWSAAGAVVIGTGHKTFAKKINHGYEHTAEPWLFVVGDDVHFHPGWLDQAQHTAATQHADVIGTNDLGNPRVMAGTHATHLLISRAYVDDQGASWDGPKVVCHEGYHHWYVDDEIVTAARQRQAWAMALGSRVEHLHPLWGKAANDAVYELGQSHQEADRATYAQRLERFGTR